MPRETPIEKPGAPRVYFAAFRGRGYVRRSRDVTHGDNDHVHFVIKTRGATLMIYVLLCL